MRLTGVCSGASSVSACSAGEDERSHGSDEECGRVLDALSEGAAVVVPAIGR